MGRSSYHASFETGAGLRMTSAMRWRGLGIVAASAFRGRDVMGAGVAD